MAFTTPILIFSDLDGTLLDHHDYSFAAAEPALKILRDNDVPLVLASSKTAAEMRIIRKETGFSHCPAIVENGAGVLPPDGEDTTDESTYPDLIAALQSLPDEVRGPFRGFHDISTSEIAEATGLSQEAAERAADRRFSEPGTWQGSPEGLQAFVKALAEKGIEARRGGRFLTLSFGADKAKRMDEIRNSLFGKGTDVLVVALGDAPNDVAMLRAAHFGVIVANPAHEPVPHMDEEARGIIFRTQKPGPAGWNESVLWLLSKVAEASRGKA